MQAPCWSPPTTLASWTGTAPTIQISRRYSTHPQVNLLTTHVLMAQGLHRPDRAGRGWPALRPQRHPQAAGRPRGSAAWALCRRAAAPLLLPSSAHLLLCASAPPRLCACSSALLLFCSSAPLLFCSSAPPLILVLRSSASPGPPLFRSSSHAPRGNALPAGRVMARKKAYEVEHAELKVGLQLQSLWTIPTAAVS